MSRRINDLGDEVWINLSGKICRFMYNSGSKDTVYRSRMGHYIGTPTTRLCAFSLDGICALPATDAVATGEVSRYNCTIRLRTLPSLKLTGRGGQAASPTTPDLKNAQAGVMPMFRGMDAYCSARSSARWLLHKYAQDGVQRYMEG